jgi:hypothetical protein
MTKLARDLIKYVRDKAKSRYVKSSSCFVCESSDNLDFHHFYSLTELLNVWMRKNRYNPSTEEEILNIRDAFIESHTRHLYDEAVTLCHNHHVQLHSVYGKNPGLGTAEKQKRWLEKLRNGMV